MDLNKSETDVENTWCPGCGNFAILQAVKKSIPKLEEKGIKRSDIVMTAGIGCHAKIFDYLNLSGVYSLHGRDIATIQGIKIANPDLKVITFSGDGNGMGEGFAHTMFAAKRNMDMTMVLHHNDVYALTTGQFTPLTEKGWKGPSTPKGSFEDPFNALLMILIAGGTFIARCYSGELNHLTETIIKAIEHKGFSFIEVIQPAVSYHAWTEYKDKMEFLENEPSNFEEALLAIRKNHKFTLGTFYNSKKPVYHEQLYGEHNPITKKVTQEKRIQKLEKILNNL
ncbi:MAG: 2-oxoacid:ferredoxin oxidoreductase subunit beta [Candidatus Lokiarchaeota archaeon]|nr:2-oxoacid:ferredoxin oxidoreductase subunit beta [Candidatus Lokiarchaeota archaeon]